MAKPEANISQPIPSVATALSRKPLSSWQSFCQSPLNFLAERLYVYRRIPRSTASPLNPIRVVCISDTHDLQPELPDGDLLLHAGDLTSKGTFNQLQAQLTWLNSQSHRYKVIIAGNHDLLLDDDFDQPRRIHREPGRERKDLNWGSLTYLQNESVSLMFSNGRHLKIYGSPWTSQFGTWAFQYPPIRDVFSRTLPPGTDIFLTHGPPKYHLDYVNQRGAQGCPHLAQEVWRADGALKLVVFGHIHRGHGREDVPFDRIQQLRENIRLGILGFAALVELGFRLLVDELTFLFSPQESFNLENRHYVTFINAAIAVEPWEDFRPPIVVEI